MSQPEWERFFDGHAPKYLDNGFTKATVAEVDFILGVLELPPGASILDVGCGVGRHSLELARRGYRVTGADLSAGMLAQGRRAAADADLSVEWIQTDAARSLPRGPFSAVICLCEGAFCLLSSADDPFAHDRAILDNMHLALEPGGRLVLTALNGMRPIRASSQASIASGAFDPLTLTEHSEMPVDGAPPVRVRERSYVPAELRSLVDAAGFEVLALWGGTAGRFGRRPPELDEMELMVHARRRQG